MCTNDDGIVARCDNSRKPQLLGLLSYTPLSSCLHTTSSTPPTSPDPLTALAQQCAVPIPPTALTANNPHAGIFATLGERWKGLARFLERPGIDGGVDAPVEHRRQKQWHGKYY